ncbi:MAG: type II toxin-antitoxin system VapC family toxin [Tagaea sp.]|nr:type II toxin-antitoxin system VapC family toxin [Tagaea sp.]
MIVVDSSALVAIFEAESDAPRYAQVIADAERLAISAVNVHETGAVLRLRRGAAVLGKLWRFLIDQNGFEIVAFDAAQARAAMVAFDRYGKGIDPRARLNLADCAAYALATTLDVPLLFKGGDFAATDVRVALEV